MSKPTPKRRDERPTPPRAIGPRNPEAWTRIRDYLAGHDQWVRDLELRWGIGRLACLVSDVTRAKFRRGMEQWQAALTAADPDAIERLAPMIRHALGVMEREALAAGHQPLAPEVWEARRDDGTVVALVRTQAEATRVAADGRDVTVYTLAEIVNLLPSLVDAIKAHFPGARVDKLVTLSEGDALDHVTADPFGLELMGDAA